MEKDEVEVEDKTKKVMEEDEKFGQNLLILVG